MKKEIAFIVVTYKPDNKMLDALRSALRGHWLIEIDNSKRNLGYAGGANVGIRKALAGGAQWMVVMNQDLSLTSEAVSKFSLSLTKAPLGIVGPFAGGLDPRRWTTMFPSERKEYITGSMIAVHKSVVEKVGFFYEPYFLYYEEVDLCIRAKRAGFQLTHKPIDGISHEESVSLGKGSLAHQYYLARNHMLFIERCAPPQVRLYEYLRLPKTIAEHLGRRERGGALGIRDYLLRRFGQYNRGQ
jgi:hypothetical protein